MRRFLFAAVLALLAMSQARADLRILSSPGGYVGDYLQAFARVRQSGERVIIDGPCLSACTLVLSTIPSNRICVTREPSSASMRREWLTARQAARHARPRPRAS